MPVDTEGETINSTSVVGNQAVIFLDPEEMNVISPTPVPAPTQGATLPSTLTDIAEVMGNMMAVGPVHSIPKYTVVDGRIVADQAFYRNDSLEEVALKDGITEIGQFAFARSTQRRFDKRITAGIHNERGAQGICFYGYAGKF